MTAISEPCWMVYAGFAIGLLTLAVLIWYAWLTRGIERAANEQSEGLSKPALTLQATPRSPTFNENFTEILNRKMLTRAEPDAEGYLVMINIGNGPALHVQYEIRDTAPQGGKPWTGRVAYVHAGKPMPLPLKSGNFIMGKHHKITCLYDSLSGNRYESVVELDGDEIEDFRFSRIGSG